MEEKDKEIATLKDQVVALTGQVTTLTTENQGLKTEKETLTKTVGEKDKIIEQKTKDIVGQRGQYKKMAERSKEELDAMTESEKEALSQAERNATELESIKKETAERNKREFDARKANVISKYAGKNPDIAKKIEENLAKLNPTLLEKAVTEADLQPLVELAYNGLGTIKPNAVGSAATAAGGEAHGDGGDKKDFADTPEGQAMLGVIAPTAVEKKA